ncbi:hypothetical protein CR513_44749, partial [Mucuna pruriens]
MHGSSSPLLQRLTLKLFVHPCSSSDNYNSWCKSTHMTLITKYKLDFVDGSILAPLKVDQLHHLWLHINNIITSWLSNSISKEIILSTNVEIWQDLKDCFQQHNKPHKISLLPRLSQFERNLESICQFVVANVDIGLNNFLSNQRSNYSLSFTSDTFLIQDKHQLKHHYPFGENACPWLYFLSIELLLAALMIVILSSCCTIKHSINVFGCLCFVSTISTTKSKFSPHAIPCTFMGYPIGIKGYKVYDPNTRKFLISRYVIF